MLLINNGQEEVGIINFLIFIESTNNLCKVSK